jgi:hypothetical protein
MFIFVDFEAVIFFENFRGLMGFIVKPERILQVN